MMMERKAVHESGCTRTCSTGEWRAEGLALEPLSIGLGSEAQSKALGCVMSPLSECRLQFTRSSIA
jgi:hypothetical protein